MKRMIPMLFAAISIAATLHAGDEYSYRYKADKADKGDKASEKAEAAVEREEDLYDEANDALDEHDYRRAAKMFSDVSRMKMAHADAATYAVIVRCARGSLIEWPWDDLSPCPLVFQTWG